MYMVSTAEPVPANLAQFGTSPAHPINGLVAPVLGTHALEKQSRAGSILDKSSVWLSQGMPDGLSGQAYGESRYSGGPAMLVGTDVEGYPSHRQGNQLTLENDMMIPTWQVPEQTIISGSDVSDTLYRGAVHNFQVLSMEALPSMAMWSMDSLPMMSGISMDALPVVAMCKPDCPAFAVHSADSLPSLPAGKAGLKSKKYIANKRLPASNAKQIRASDACMPDQKQMLQRAVAQQMQQLANRNQQATPLGSSTDLTPQCQKHVNGTSQEVMSSHATQPKVQSPETLQDSFHMGKEDLKVVKEPDVDPVCLELESDDIAMRHRTLEWVIVSVWPLVLTRRGCRILQKALDVGTPLHQAQILSRVEGHVQEAMRSPHGNYVLQKCIEVAAPERVQFIIDELKGDAVVAARHRFGCRILQRLIEHCPAEQTDGITAEVLEDVGTLCRHQFGNFVVQHILQHGSNKHKTRIVDVLQGQVLRLAKHRIASHVLTCAMVHCSPDDVQRLTKVVLADRGQLVQLSRREIGSFVVREVNRAHRLHSKAAADSQAQASAKTREQV